MPRLQGFRRESLALAPMRAYGAANLNLVRFHDPFNARGFRRLYFCSQA